MRCPECGAEIPDSSKFCSNCGARQTGAGKSYCKYCGAHINAGDSFCPGCGKALNGTPSYAAAQSGGYNPNDTGSAGWFVLAFLFPFVGLILWLLWADTKPNDSRMARNGFIASILFSVIVSILLLAVLYTI